MKHHSHIYPRGTDSWWCGGYVPARTGGFGGECIHATPASAEVCARNPTRFRSPSDDISAALQAGAALDAAAVDTLAAATGQSRKDAWWRFDAAKQRLYAMDGSAGFEDASDDGMVKAFDAAEDAMLCKETSGGVGGATGPTLPEIVEMLMGCAKCVSETRCAIGACLKARLAVRICIERQRG